MSYTYQLGRYTDFGVQEMVEQFSFMFSHALEEGVPEPDSALEIQDWGAGLLPHWETLRRRVNNMRSDPGGRWVGLDYSALLRRVVEGVVRELELEMDHLDLTRVQTALDRLASFKLASLDCHQETGNY